MIDLSNPYWLSEPIGPSYKIYRYKENIYKIVHFKSTAPRLGIRDHSKFEKHESKLDASVSRARRMVLEYALCNDWKYFCTFTIGGSRHDLTGWLKQFLQYIRDLRKKHQISIQYLLVPEQHQDGAWHMHGLFSDITPLLVSFQGYWDNGVDVPYKLVAGQYYDWPDYSSKFGFCSFGDIADDVAVAFYITKYVSKSISKDTQQIGKHLYFASRGLNRSTFHGDVYYDCAYLNRFLVNHYDFCDTGMTHVKDGCTWNFAMEYMDVDMMESFGVTELTEMPEVDNYFEAVQEVIAGF